eukprot:1731030-Ditylum_brightwellii.AAC.1
MKGDRHGNTHWDNDEKEEIDTPLSKRTRRLDGNNKVDETTLSYCGFVNVPDKQWKNELSKDEKDFVVLYDSKKRHEESTNGLDVPKRFERVLSSNSEDDRDNKVRRRLGFNLNVEDEKNEKWLENELCDGMEDMEVTRVQRKIERDGDGGERDILVFNTGGGHNSTITKRAWH